MEAIVKMRKISPRMIAASTQPTSYRVKSFPIRVVTRVIATKPLANILRTFGSKRRTTCLYIIY